MTTKMTRMQFLKSIAVGAGVIGLAACDDNVGDPGEGGVRIDMKSNDAGSTSSCSASISGNHGHTISIPKGDLEAAASEKTFTLTVGSGHTHTITLSPSQQMQLKSGGMASVVSSPSGDHTHNVTVACS